MLLIGLLALVLIAWFSAKAEAKPSKTSAKVQKVESQDVVAEDSSLADDQDDAVKSDAGDEDGSYDQDPATGIDVDDQDKNIPHKGKGRAHYRKQREDREDEDEDIVSERPAEHAVRNQPRKVGIKRKEWSGVWLGLNTGWARGDASINQQFQVVRTTDEDWSRGNINSRNKNGKQNPNAQTFLGDLSAGYDFQLGPVVLGIGASFGSLGLSGDQSIRASFPDAPVATYYTERSHFQTNWLAAIQPRVGFIAGYFLAYVTGGVAFSDIEYEASFDSPADYYIAEHSSGHLEKVIPGWDVGLGCQYKFSKHWAVNAEYLYFDFGKQSLDAKPDPNPVYTEYTNGDAKLNYDAELKVNLIKCGIEYQF